MLTINYPDKTKRKQIIKLALPIIFGMLSFTIIDIVDTLMVGTLGNSALAAMGFASFLFWASYGFVVGIASSIQTITARRLGENKVSECGLPLNAGLILVSIYAIFLSIILILLAPFIFRFFSTDPEVIALTTTYFSWRVVGLIAISYTIIFRGFWNGIKKPNTYTMILVATHALNIFLNWVFIFGHLGSPAMGLKGAAMASTLALYFGATLFIIVTLYQKSFMGVLTKLPTLKIFKRLISLGWPASLESFTFLMHLAGMFWIFGKIGTEASAIAHVVVTCIMFLWLPGIGFGMASLSLVSESLGQGSTQDAKFWAWDVVKVSVPIIFGMGAFLFCFPELILKQFIHIQSTLKAAIFPFRLDLVTIWTTCIGVIFSQSLIGAGATQLVMNIKTISRWLFLLPGSYFIGVYLGYGINGIWMYWVFVCIIEALVLAGFWKKERWSQLNV